MSWFTDPVEVFDSKWNKLGGIPKRWVGFVAGVVVGAVTVLIFR